VGKEKKKKANPEPSHFKGMRGIGTKKRRKGKPKWEKGGEVRRRQQ